MFNSIREFVNALMEGRKFQYKGYTYFFYEEEGFSRWHQFHGRKPMSYSDFLYFDSANLEEIIEPKWYENIPKTGILCKVQKNKESRFPFEVAIISSFNVADDYPYLGKDGVDYYSATPLTKEEALEFIYEGDEQ